ncbi:MAG: ROK family protein [Microbacteriaceae bacterium]
MATGSLGALRAANKAAVIEVLGAGPVAQAEIVRRTGLSPATVTGLVRELLADGAVTTAPGVWSGRRATIVTLASAPARPLAAVSLTRAGIDRAVWDAAGPVFASVGWDEAPELREDPAQLADRLRALAEDSGAAAMVVCVPGWIAMRDSVTVPPAFARTHPLAGWMAGGARLAAMREDLGIPVEIRNDADMAALAELRGGAARGVRNALYLEASEGVGGAFVFGGELFTGDAGLAGEIGHVPGAEHGPRCWCGNRGCLEQLIGAEALLSSLPPLAGEPGRVTLGDLVAAANGGVELAIRTVADAGRDAGFALAPMLQALNVGTVVVGGVLSAAAAFVSAVEASVTQFAPLLGARVRVRPAVHGARGIVLGGLFDAARLAGLSLEYELNT